MAASKEWTEAYENVNFHSQELRQEVEEKLLTGEISKEEDALFHFVVYFLPYNPNNKSVFLVFDKRVGGLWLAPGGHVKKNESPREAASRETNEELGISVSIPDFPFCVGKTFATNPKRPCKVHYDFWYLITTDGSTFKLTEEEFSEHKWLGINDALKLVTDPSTNQALLALTKLN